MIAALQRFFEQHIAPVEGESSAEHRLQLATAAVLIEVERADFEASRIERDHIVTLIQDHLSLSEQETSALVDLAEAEVESSVSLHQFTALINQHMSAEQKEQMVEMMWSVAFADARIDKHEDYLIRKVAELLYVPHSGFIRAKHRAEAAAQGSAEK